jgi:hypothetical protein
VCLCSSNEGGFTEHAAGRLANFGFWILDFGLHDEYREVKEFEDWEFDNFDI